MRKTFWGVLTGLLLAPGLAAQTTTDPEAVNRGVKVYAAQKCALCHSIDGKGNPKGPLDDVGARLTAEEIRQWLIAPRAMSQKMKATRKPPMPEYTKLSKEDLEGLVAYMASLKGR